MTENFINFIQINRSMNIADLSIPLSDIERKHLIIIGKNGSGKSTLLNNIRYFFDIIHHSINEYTIHSNKVELLKQDLYLTNTSTILANLGEKIQKEELNLERKRFSLLGGVNIYFSNWHSTIKKITDGKFILAFFSAKRDVQLKIPTGINKVQLNQKYNLSDRASYDFIQYIVNLKADRSFARDDNEENEVSRIDEWFIRFEKRLKYIFDSPDLKLVFDRKNYNFNISIGDAVPFNFSILSDGYSAIISIVTELLLRMEAHEAKSYDLEGLVFIDEIETHLHVDLQKKILPFLTDFFPKIQFIVTTHSPFVLSSISNSVICDLENSIVTEDLSGYSYDALIESYFNSDKYSYEVKDKLSDLERLSKLKILTPEDKASLSYLKNYFKQLPKYLSLELLVKLQQIELDSLNN